jgi:hypothetical protein
MNVSGIGHILSQLLLVVILSSSELLVYSQHTSSTWGWVMRRDSLSVPKNLIGATSSVCQVLQSCLDKCFHTKTLKAGAVIRIPSAYK